MTGSRPTRATVAGRAYLDLQKLARATGRPTPELLQLHVLECFIVRVADSPLAERLILKGGLLLAAYSARRPTQDVDLAARGLTSGARELLGLVKEVAEGTTEDGVIFDSHAATVERIREATVYGAVRISMPARLSSAKLVLQVDLNVGDPMVPDAVRVEVPRVLGGSFTTLGYPLSMILAEKLVTALERADANTRWRDFVDVALLVSHNPVNGDELLASIGSVAAHRSVRLTPLADVLARYADVAQRRWEEWRRKHSLEDRTPQRFDELLGRVVAFADPAFSGRIAGLRWRPAEAAWS